MWKAGRFIQEPINRRSPASRILLKPAEEESEPKGQKGKAKGDRCECICGTRGRFPMAKPERGWVQADTRLFASVLAALPMTAMGKHSPV